MKTRVLVFAALLLGGLIFTSCQKDNALYEDSALAKSEFVVDTINPDPISNSPDPFLNITTITYSLEETAQVRLTVNNTETGYARLLYEGLRPAGTHIYKFKAHNLPNGEYIAKLQIRDEVFTEVMTKKGISTAQDIQDEGLEE